MNYKPEEDGHKWLIKYFENQKTTYDQEKKLKA